jgi:hypothetical protein
MLYDRHDQPLLEAIVRVNNVDESGQAGRATLSRCTLLQSWIPSGRPEPPIYFNDDHPLIPRLAAFLEARLNLQGTNAPRPRFEFIDGRHQANAMEPSPWAQSYQQRESSSGENRATGQGIFQGLLLTLVLHSLQLLWLPLTRVNDKFFLAFFISDLRNCFTCCLRSIWLAAKTDEA